MLDFVKMTFRQLITISETLDAAVEKHKTHEIRAIVSERWRSPGVAYRRVALGLGKYGVATMLPAQPAQWMLQRLARIPHKLDQMQVAAAQEVVSHFPEALQVRWSPDARLSLSSGGKEGTNCKFIFPKASFLSQVSACRCSCRGPKASSCRGISKRPKLGA